MIKSQEGSDQGPRGPGSRARRVLHLYFGIDVSVPTLVSNRVGWPLCMTCVTFRVKGWFTYMSGGVGLGVKLFSFSCVFLMHVQ